MKNVPSLNARQQNTHTHTRTVSSLSAVSEYGRREKNGEGGGGRIEDRGLNGLGKESLLQTADESLSPLLLTICRGLLLRYIQSLSNPGKQNPVLPIRDTLPFSTSSKYL